MNFVKPTIRVRLERQVIITMHGQRDCGPDYWVATTTLATTEGQQREDNFRSVVKERALEKAYHFLNLCIKHDTFNYEEAKEIEEFRIKRKAYGASRKPEMEDHYVEIPAPPPKWSFWNWFK